MIELDAGRRGTSVTQLVVADEQHHQVGGHRFVLSPGPCRLPARVDRALERSVGHRRRPLGHGDLERPCRLVGRVIVGRHPCARAIRLVHGPDPLPLDSDEQPGTFGEVAAARDLGLELDGDSEGVAGWMRLTQSDHQLTVGLLERQRTVGSADGFDDRATRIECDLVGRMEKRPRHLDHARDRQRGGVIAERHVVVPDVDVGRSETRVADVAGGRRARHLDRQRRRFDLRSGRPTWWDPERAMPSCSAFDWTQSPTDRRSCHTLESP